MLLSLLALGVASCGSSPSHSSTPPSTKTSTTQPASPKASGSASITLTGALKGKLTHVNCQDPETAFITGTIKATTYELQVSAAKYNVHYVMLWPGSTPTDGWYAVMSSADSINAAGGSVRDTLPPNPNGSASGTVRASGHWSC